MIYKLSLLPVYLLYDFSPCEGAGAVQGTLARVAVGEFTMPSHLSPLLRDLISHLLQKVYIYMHTYIHTQILLLPFPLSSAFLLTYFASLCVSSNLCWVVRIYILTLLRVSSTAFIP